MAYSHSSIKTHETCPAQYKFSRIDKLPSESGPAAERGKLLHSECEEFIKGGLELLSPDIEHLRHILTILKKGGALSEEPLAVNDKWEPVQYDSETAMLRGVLDVLSIEGPIAYLRDFKSGKKRDYSEQMKLYATMIFACYPAVNVVQPIIEWLDLKKTERYDAIHVSTQGDLRDWIEKRITTIKEDEIYAPNPSSYCRGCSYRKDNGGPCRW